MRETQPVGDTRAASLSSDPDRAPIFIIGAGRSGTSLLRAMLNAHPRIHLAQEASFYTWTEMPPPWWSGARRLDLYLRSFSFAWLELDMGRVRDAFPPPVPRERLGEVFRWILRELAARHGKPRWGEKNPTYAVHLERLFADFPGARVVRMVRDPRGMIASHARMPFSSPSALLWGLMLGRGVRRLAPFLDSMLTLRMEDLVADPRSALERVLSFVGEPWDEAVLDHPRHLGSDDGPPYPWVVDGYARPEARPPSWPRQLSPARIRLVERLTRGWMHRHDYRPAELATEPSRREVAREIATDAAAGAAYLGRGLHAARRLLGRRAVDPAETQRIFLSLNPAAWKHHPHWSLPDPPPLAASAEEATLSR